MAPLGDSGQPWSVAGRRRRQTQAEARMLALMRSAIHESQTWTNQRRQAQTRQTKASADSARWAHREAEWLCKKCSCPNLLHRTACRRCGEPWAVGCQHLPPGSPPTPKPAAAPGAATSNSPKPAAAAPWQNPPKVPDAVKKAEAALQAATQAELDEDTLKRLRDNVSKQKQAESEKQPLAKRLQQATHQATVAEAAHTKAQERLQAATKAAADAEAALREARASVDAITAELAKTAPQTEDVKQPDTRQLLADLLAAVKAAAADQGANGTREALEKAAVAAETATAPAPTPDASMASEEGTATAAASAGSAALSPGAAAAAQANKAAEAAKRAQEYLDLLQETSTPEAKRAKLEEAISRSMGPDLVPFSPTQEA